MKKDNLKVILLVAPPASGKTTFALDFISKNKNYVRVNRDAFRLMFRNEQVCEYKIENLITEIQDRCILSALNQKQNVIIDNTHVKKQYINHIINLVKYKADIEFIVIETPLQTCIERDENRVGKVGSDVIKRMFKDFENLKTIFDFKPISMEKDVYIEPIINPNLDDVYIFDIDGTLAHHNNARSPYDWKKVGNDTVDVNVSNQLKFHYEKGHKVFILSGRDAICRTETEKWLNDNNIMYHELYMRDKNDSRKDTIIKREIYENNIKDKFNVRVIYDDRNSVVEMWRSLGLKCFQVQEGDF